MCTQFFYEGSTTNIQTFTGYTAPAPFSVDASTKKLYLKMVSGATPAPSQYGPRKWEVYIKTV